MGEHFTGKGGVGVNLHKNNSFMFQVAQGPDAMRAYFVAVREPRASSVPKTCPVGSPRAFGIKLQLLRYFKIDQIGQVAAALVGAGIRVFFLNRENKLDREISKHSSTLHCPALGEARHDPLCLATIASRPPARLDCATTVSGMRSSMSQWAATYKAFARASQNVATPLTLDLTYEALVADPRVGRIVEWVGLARRRPASSGASKKTKSQRDAVGNYDDIEACLRDADQRKNPRARTPRPSFAGACPRRPRAHGQQRREAQQGRVGDPGDLARFPSPAARLDAWLELHRVGRETGLDGASLQSWFLAYDARVADQRFQVAALWDATKLDDVLAEAGYNVSDPEGAPKRPRSSWTAPT
ncbi:hypothetical protein JL721_7775 [Aureococcus anophagefferens]|nr:hypothetical protein JL721_7775 [Aureococcus anophagefferens]